MPHKFIVGREIAPLLVKVRRSGRGLARHGGVRSVKVRRLRQGPFWYGGSRRSRRGKSWYGMVGHGKIRRSGFGTVR